MKWKMKPKIQNTLKTKQTKTLLALVPSFLFKTFHLKKEQQRGFCGNVYFLDDYALSSIVPGRLMIKRLDL
jgi:hypothetical protein